jgi:hypothetical protein
MVFNYHQDANSEMRYGPSPSQRNPLMSTRTSPMFINALHGLLEIKPVTCSKDG